MLVSRFIGIFKVLDLRKKIFIVLRKKFMFLEIYFVFCISVERFYCIICMLVL